MVDALVGTADDKAKRSGHSADTTDQTPHSLPEWGRARQSLAHLHALSTQEGPYQRAGSDWTLQQRGKSKRLRPGRAGSRVSRLSPPGVTQRR